MTIETNLNQAPHHDDFNESKQFHRVLFRPGRAVQARELTQLQTILQNQIERFGNEVLIDGTVVTGVGLTTHSVDYVKIRDKDANNRVLLLADFFTGSNIANVVITGETTGMTARLVDAKEGSEAAAPNNLSLFVQYTNSGSNNTTKAFATNEVLIARYTGNNNFVVAANTITANATGLGFRASVTDGIIYHKGHFELVNPQSLIVEKFSNIPNKKIGFETRESIIDSNEDSSLLDNATGSSNENAPGADRLKLEPILAARDLSAANTTTFFTIATVESGQIVKKSTDTLYSHIGDYVARRVFETNGNYAISPFNIRVREHLRRSGNLGRYNSDGGGDVNKLVAEVDRGAGYVSGRRVELRTPVFRDVDKATDFEVKDARTLGQAFGHYVFANEVVGTWDFQGLRTVSLRDTAQGAITSRLLGSQGAQGSQIGTARIRGIQYHSGTSGTVAGRFRIYLFDVQMNASSSFADVRGLFVNNTSGPNSAADIVLETDGTAKIQESGLNTLVFPFAQKGTKTLRDENNNIDTQFVFRTEKTVNFSTDGTVTVTANSAHAGGTETMNDTGTPLTNNDERNLIVVARQTVNTAPHTGTITTFSGNTITGSATAFQNSYQVGDLISIADGANTITGRITNIPSSTSIDIADNIGYTRSGVTLAHKTTFPTGYVFDLSGNGSVTSTTTQHQIDLQQANLASVFTASVYFDVLRSDATQTAKIVNKDHYVHINTGSHSASKNGPWPLGVSDAFKLVAVYSGSNTSVTTSDNDVTSEFELITGQTDAFYDTAKIKLKETSTLDLTNKGLLVRFNYFDRDRSSGIGFLSVDSYPIDDVNTSNTNAIMTQDIPKYTSPNSGRTFDLRDAVDFRPYKANTVATTTTATVAAAPTNPASSTSFNIDSDGAYMPTPDQNFQADVQFYLSRKDRIVLTSEGDVEVIKGVPAIYPQAPNERTNSMTLAILNVPVYPSLSSFVAQDINRNDYRVTTTVENNRRYTMGDLRAIEGRVRNLEYYSSLNSLEASARNKQLFGDTGLDRFKNGILVDNFQGHNIVDTNKVGFKAAIDISRSQLRPSFIRKDITMNKDNTFTSANMQKTGNIVTLSYNNVVFDSQPYASKQRNPVQELTFVWRGELILNPPQDIVSDTVQAPDIQIDFSGFRSAEQALGGGSTEVTWGDWTGGDFGEWRGLDSDPAVIENLTNIRFTDSDNGQGGTQRFWEAEQQSTETRVGIQTIVTPQIETISVGTEVVDVSVAEFMRSRRIQVTGNRMKPNTRVYPFFDDELVSDYVIPANSSFSATGTAGDALVTDSTGSVYATFTIPNDSNLRFRTGTRRLEFKDVANTQTQSDLVTTQAHGDFTSSQTTTTVRDVFQQIVTWETETVEVVETRDVFNTVSLLNPAIDPILQTFYVTADDSPGVFITKVGLFFAEKSSTLPVTVQIREIENGQPTRDIVPFGRKTLPSSSVNANSTIANTETQFIFDSPVFLKNNTEYGLVVIPAGNSDDYAVWVAELGGTDIDTDQLIDKQPGAGILFSSANDRSWSPIQSEDMKYTLYRADFTTNTGTLYIENDDIDFFDVDNFSGQFRVGEAIEAEAVITLQGVTGNTSAISVGNIISNTNGSTVSNGTIRSIVTDHANGTVIVKIDPYSTNNFTVMASANGQVSITGSQFTNGNAKIGAFTANTSSSTVEFVDVAKKRLNVAESNGGYSNGFIRGQETGAVARVLAANNAVLNTLIPRIPELTYANTATSWSVRTTSTSGVISSSWTDVAINTENNIIDGEKKVYGKTNETGLTAVNGSKKSLVLRGTFDTTDTKVSPIIDDSRSNAFIIENVINNVSTNEHKEVGDSEVRYVSLPIVLADGQEAEDLIVYLTAYKPQGTEISVYAQIKNGEDGEEFNDKDYSPLRQVTSSNTYSDSVSTSDFIEFEYTFSANTNGQGFLSTANSHAYLNTANNNVVAYRATDGSIHHTYKTFAIKIVMTSTGTNVVPLVNDMRAIALQK